MSAGNVRNDFLLFPMDSPKMSSHYRPITLMALSVQNLIAQCMMKVGLLPIGNLNKKIVKHDYYGSTSDQHKKRKQLHAIPTKAISSIPTHRQLQCSYKYAPIGKVGSCASFFQKE